MNLEISRKYQPLRDRKTRYYLLTGGRGSQKSFAVSEWLCKSITTFKDWKVLFTRWTLKSAEISIIPEFTEKLHLLNVADRCRVAGWLVECKDTGSSIIFSGIKAASGTETARLKSIPGLNVFVVDEAEEFVSEKDFITIDDSIRQKGLPNIVILIMNPQDTEHWIWQRWFEKSHRMELIDSFQIPISTHQDVTHIHTTWFDNARHLNADYIAKIERLKADNPEAYAHRYLGKWLDRKEGVVYPNWVEGEFDTSLSFAYGLDLGFHPDPLALVRVAVDTTNMKVYVHEEIYKTRLSDEDAVIIMLDRVEPGVMVVNDTSEPRLIDLLARRGLNMQNAEKGKDSVKEGIRQLSKFQIVVTPESYNVKHELRNYIWNDKKSSIPVDADNHALDAMRYIATRLLEGSTVLAYK